MRLEQLRYLMAIIECRSFNKASKILHITQPALTSAIKALEDEIGVCLLARDSKGVIATTIGQKVYEDTIAFMKYFDEMVQSWKPAKPDEGISGVARIMAIPTICAWLAEYFLPEFYKKYPAISVPIEESEYLSFITSLRSSKANIGLTASLREYEEADLALFSVNGFSAVPLLEDEYAIIMSHKHPLAKKELLDSKDCENLRICTYSASAHHPRSPITPIMKTLGVSLEKQVFLNSRETITQMLYDGKHVTILLEKMMAKSWPVREGLLTIRKVKGISLGKSRHWLLFLDKNLLTPPELCAVEWLREKYASFWDTL